MCASCTVILAALLRCYALGTLHCSLAKLIIEVLVVDVVLEPALENE